MHHPLRYLFFNAFARPLLLILIGLNVRRRHLLPSRGPALLIANHNSHLDTLMLMLLFSSTTRRRVRPVAAADYFLKNRVLAWFATRIIGILPIDRANIGRTGSDGQRMDPLLVVTEALDREEIVILFPEGTRGEPEHLGKFQSGVAHIVRKRPDVPVTPVFIHGLGKALPRGEALLVPFFCDAFVGEPIYWTGDRTSFMNKVHDCITTLAGEANRPTW
ncbi:MAG: 1-acyl-sn-glycerol-3-phosphate acyltransferase [Planctomycetes bacterium]|nr:1-acyl-sn-glycerol-3-phosphate acyltransferase [Planctomycetota bacterium]